MMKRVIIIIFAAVVLMGILGGCSETSKVESQKNIRVIVASDTILSGMMNYLLPQHLYSVVAILPPGQCPGHYDVKLSDIEMIKKADLVVSFKGMPFMNTTVSGSGKWLVIDTQGHNWMSPGAYVHGLGLLADKLAEYFPEDKDMIMSRKEDAVRDVKAYAGLITGRIEQAHLIGRPVIASSMQKEPLEWMGFRVIEEYGRPESISAREVVRLSAMGRKHRVIFIADNLQSGPDAGKGIAESLGVPHVTLTNFPSEKGYLATLEENMNIIIAAAARK